MKLLVYGASGMIGSGLLIECLDHPDVDEVIVVGRRGCGVEHEKITEVVTPDVTDLSSVAGELPGLDACIFSLGVSSSGMDEASYTAITYDLTMAVARTLHEANPKMSFVFVSGAATDSTEKGRIMWARVKGRAENALLSMGFGGAWMFRPGYIHPLKGVKSATPLYNTLYAISTPFYGLLKRVAKNSVLTSVDLGLAMIRAARDGAEKGVLEVPDIIELARAEHEALAGR